MAKPKIIKEVAISMVDVKEEIAKIKEKTPELGIRTVKTEEYVTAFVKITRDQEKELRKKIEEVGVARLKPEHITKIIDIMPIVGDDVKMLFQSYAVNINSEQSKKIADIVKEYA